MRMYHMSDTVYGKLQEYLHAHTHIYPHTPTPAHAHTLTCPHSHTYLETYPYDSYNLIYIIYYIKITFLCELYVSKF